MSLKGLSNEGMINISGAWLDERRSKSAFMAVPEAAALVPALREAHDGILALAQPVAPVGADTTPDDPASDLATEAAAADAIHDRKARGQHLVLTGLAELADDPAVAARLLSARDHILPKGLSIALMTHGEEAGNAAGVRQHLSDGVLGVLESVPSVEGRTLKDETLAWLDAGDELGRIETKRKALAVEEQGQADRRPIANEARNRWIRVVSTIETILDLAPVTDEARRLLLKELEDAREKARQKEKRRAKKRAQPDA
ncbi:MAG: hypothetical protein HYV07_33920 [Deltaproteobacteria bacterium]|nr:hypothetical protein [Deltaproteobacteria bacterium]